MNKYIYILLLIIFAFKSYSYADSNGIKKIEIEKHNFLTFKQEDLDKELEKLGVINNGKYIFY